MFNGLLKCEFLTKNKWKLIEPLTFEVKLSHAQHHLLSEFTAEHRVKKLENGNTLIHVEEGFVCDLASIPRILWIFLSPWDIARPAVIHDSLYVDLEKYTKSTPEFAAYRKVADEVFAEALKETMPLVNNVYRTFCFRAVRAFGHRTFK